MAAFVVMALGSAVAGILRGLTGFGSNMVLFPIVSIVAGPVVAAPVVTAVDYASAVLLLPDAFRRCRWPEVARISMGSAAFVFVGVGALVFLDGDVLLLAAALFILAVVRPLWRKWRYRGRPHWAVNYAVGALSGFTGGATTLAGPPLALFWLGGDTDARTFRANVIAFFGLTEGLAIFAYGAKGLYSEPVLALCVTLVGFFALGQWLGAKVFPHTSEERFRKIALVLIILVALVSLFKAATNLLERAGLI
jgi:uncharacterized membrane protein YfcA